MKFAAEDSWFPVSSSKQRKRNYFNTLAVDFRGSVPERGGEEEDGESAVEVARGGLTECGAAAIGGKSGGVPRHIILERRATRPDARREAFRRSRRSRSISTASGTEGGGTSNASSARPRGRSLEGDRGQGEEIEAGSAPANGGAMHGCAPCRRGRTIPRGKRAARG